MQVSENTKNAYRDNSITKHVVISFPNSPIPDITMDRIYFETVKLYESVMESENLEFVGCISSKFSIQAYGVDDNIKNRHMSVKVYTDGTENEPITLFNGIVDSAVLAANKKYKEITAYDELYAKGEKDVAAWYNSSVFPMKLKEIRNSLFEHLGIEQVECDLPNDDLKIPKTYDPQTMNALGVIKSICQINGVFGIINREGKFEYRFPNNIYTDTENVDFYKNVKYEEFKTKKIGTVTIRQNGNDEGISFIGNDEDESLSRYIIVGNIFTNKLSDDTLLEVAERIYENVKNFTYYPLSGSDNNGFPWIECGIDSVEYQMLSEDSYDTYTGKTFCVLNRELTGIQNMRDRYSADGEEQISEFVSSVDAQIGTLEQAYEELLASKMVVYTYENLYAYNLGEEETNIIRIVYAANQSTTPVFIATIPVEMESDGNIVFKYYENSVALNQLTITKYLPAGKHFLTLSNFFSIEKNMRNTLRVAAKTEYVESDMRKIQADILSLKQFAQDGTYDQVSAISDIPTATIAASSIRAVLFGNGLATVKGWDGTLEITEKYRPIIIDNEVQLALSEDTLTVDKHAVNHIRGITQYINNILVSGSISVLGMSENITADIEQEENE